MLTADQTQLYSLCIQTGAIVVSAVGVIASVLWKLKIARQRATLDILLQEQSSENLIRERTLFTAIRDSGHLAQWLQPQNADSNEAGVVRASLNRYELVSLGIRKGLVDRKVSKAWFRTTLVGDWIALKPLVIELRSGEKTNTYYAEFQALARRWAKGFERDYV